MRHTMQRKRKAWANAKVAIEETTDQHTADQRTMDKSKTDQRVNASNVRPTPTLCKNLMLHASVRQCT
ncbi:hypothetical protein AB1Y20_008679 [Prymnesium parvum]|uniref:Uncharacterized protein n=1 Tax=Prymnesium parvum TaxID=97485 RepID=A0AB34IRU3_PRYPA